MSKTKWVEVGEIGVDAGLCWVGDPCYIMTPEASESPAETWHEFCDKLWEKAEKSGHEGVVQWQYRLGHDGLGVSVQTGYGDGTYPVYVRYNEEGRVAEVKVVFIGDWEEEDE